ncbi:MAG: FAD-dependent oxidoreductase [Pseudomonadota bacterium]
MKTQSGRKIILIGGGHTHALVLHALKSAPIDAAITVVNPGSTAPYSGMLPGFVAGHYTRAELDIDLQRLTSQMGAQLVDGRAVGLDPEQRKVVLENGTRLDFDLASIDVGITSKMSDLPGFTAHAVPAKPLAGFASAWDMFRTGSGSKDIAIIGGGVAGAELAMAMAFALRDDPDPVSVRLLDSGQILSRNSKTAQTHIREELEKHGVEVIEEASVVEVTAAEVVLDGPDHRPANFVVGAAGATPHGWLRDTGLKLMDGFVEIDETLQTSTPGIFAVGDCAHMAWDPRPKAGVFAVRQAPVLTENLRRTLTGEPLQKFSPQADYLKLVSLGDKRAFGEKLGWGGAGHLMWRLKDKIDRDFMNQF